MTPEIIGCNEFIRFFRDSNEDTIHVSRQRIEQAHTGALALLQAIPYEKVRNRFRILCNLDPAINQQEEAGIIRTSFRLNEVTTEFTLTARFESGGEGFTLIKNTAPKPSR